MRERERVCVCVCVCVCACSSYTHPILNLSHSSSVAILCGCPSLTCLLSTKQDTNPALNTGWREGGGEGGKRR